MFTHEPMSLIMYAWFSRTDKSIRKAVDQLIMLVMMKVQMTRKVVLKKREDSSTETLNTIVIPHRNLTSTLGKEDLEQEIIIFFCI